MMQLLKAPYPDGWYVVCHGMVGIPDGVHLPLPFTGSAPLELVAADLRRRFPRASIFSSDGRRL